ncbi:MAG: hypothetical protein JXR62_01800 [Bacilli bacterium]|nr:hypothetical protein [Bacilli bacterium]
MNTGVKLTIVNLIMWCLAFAAFTFIFILDTQFNEFPMQNYRVSTAIIFMLSNIINLVIVCIQRRNEKSDERNKYFESLSATATMIVIMLIIFSGSITLYVIYEKSGLVPVDWLWYIAYGGTFIVFIVFNLAYLIVSLKGTKYDS